MTIGSSALLTPRKLPRQARASVTVDTIFEATIQVLLVGGFGSLTTTRVANRAGVSVGTIYQYFPNKQALLYAFLERHIAMIGDAMVETCDAHHGKSLREMAEALVEGYYRAKTPQHHISQLLYSVAGELRADSLVETQAKRVEQATLTMLATASDLRLTDLQIVARTLVASVVGTVRTQLERDPAELSGAFQEHLTMMCRAYLEYACGGNADKRD